MIDRSTYNPALFRVSLLTAITVFPLLCLGSTVTTRGAGMSVPDWPNSYGYNMLLFPSSKWVGGILYEHTHRLMGTLVGFLAIVLTMTAWGPARRPDIRRILGVGSLFSVIALFFVGLIVLVVHVTEQTTDNNVSHLTPQFTSRLHLAAVALASSTALLIVAWLSRTREPRRHVRWLATLVLLAICIQGLFGGLRVTKVNLTLAIIHGCFAQACFCLVAIVVLMTSRLWGRLIEARDADLRPVAAGVWLARWSVLSVGVVFAQLVVGALMRHHQAGLAIPDFPLSYGRLLPPLNATQLEAANLQRAASRLAELEPVTLGQVWLHYGHRIGAVAVTLCLGALIVQSRRVREARLAAGRPAITLAVLLTSQLTLGVLTVLWHRPAEIASLHVVVGALVLMTTTVLCVRVVRRFGMLGPRAHSEQTNSVGQDLFKGLRERVPHQL